MTDQEISIIPVESQVFLPSTFHPNLSKQKYPESLTPIALQLQKNLEATSRQLVEAGTLLLQAKNILAHGQFNGWLQENFKLSSKTANRLMGISRMVNKLDLNSDIVDNIMKLDLSVLYEISAKSTTTEVQRQIFYEMEMNRPISYKMVRQFKKSSGHPQAPAFIPEKDFILFMRRLKQFSVWFDIHQQQLLPPQLEIQDELKAELETYAHRLKAASDVVNEILEQTRTISEQEQPDSAQSQIAAKAPQ